MQDIRIYQGKKATIPATVTDADGVVVNVTGKTLALRAVDNWSVAAGQALTVVPTVVSGVDGTIAIPFIEGDTDTLDIDAGLLRMKFYLSGTDSGDPVVLATGILHIIDAD